MHWYSVVTSSNLLGLPIEEDERRNRGEQAILFSSSNKMVKSALEYVVLRTRYTSLIFFIEARYTSLIYFIRSRGVKQERNDSAGVK